MRKPASSWMRSSMPRLPTPKSRSVVMEKRRSCLARSPLLNATPAEAAQELDEGRARQGPDQPGLPGSLEGEGADRESKGRGKGIESQSRVPRGRRGRGWARVRGEGGNAETGRDRLRQTTQSQRNAERETECEEQNRKE